MALTLPLARSSTLMNNGATGAGAAGGPSAAQRAGACLAVNSITTLTNGGMTAGGAGGIADAIVPAGGAGGTAI